MKLFRVHYRWMPRTFLRNLRHIVSDLCGGVANVIRWMPVIWFDADYDWAPLAEIMRYKLLRMAEAQDASYHTSKLREKRQILVCAELLKRLIADEYFDNAGYDEKTWHSLPQRRQSWTVKHSQAMGNQDQQYLGKMLGKYLRNWWT